MADNVEIGKSIVTGGFNTNYHDQGKGESVLLIHGSGPGVTAWANWRLTIPALSESFRVLAPDMVGFGYTERPEDVTYDMDTWVNHAINFLNEVEIEKTAIIGNSFGGALALAITTRYPQRVSRLVLMGSVGVDFDLTDGLDKVWGYTPSIENMKELLDIFAYDRSLVTDDLAELRYQASIRPGFQEAFSAMFPEPRQRWVEAMSIPEQAIRDIVQPTLIIHGREDQVIPLNNSLLLFNLIDNAQLHLFGRCGHWTQIEHAEEFNRIVATFLGEAD